MSESIICNDKECFICGTTFDLHRHHIFHQFGNRDKSEQDGCWIYLCMHHHDDYSKECIHNNPQFEQVMKMFCQYVWEQEKGTRDEFRDRFGKSYL